MRRAVVFGMGVFGAGLLALAGCSKKVEAAKTGEAAPAAAAAGPVSLPHRKAGLWSNTMSTSGITQSTKMCMGEDTDAKLSAWGQPTTDSQCAKNAITPVAGGYRVESVCDTPQGHTEVTGTITGDYATNFKMQMSMVTSGAPQPAANGTHEMTLESKLEGPCPAGMKPGDIQIAGMPGGMNIDVNAMKAAAAAAQKK